MAAPFLEDQLFPVHVSSGTAGGPDWPAEIVELSSGHEERNTRISQPRRTYDARYGVRTQNELYEVLELYYVAMGRLKGFRLKDWSDYRSRAPHQVPTHTDQDLGTGNGSNRQFQLIKRYARGAHEFFRPIRKPVAGTVRIGLNGAQLSSGWSLDAATGIVTFTAAPAAGASLTWGGEFHVPVRFDCRLDQISHRTATIGDIPSILLKEIRV
ncbi:DUF2460 domain-containing protein [Mesorhizobium sp. DCY119]|uniref:DUF2460 domain-containing protein n=1 Tax=Mesorhizobium sp. DCY119 TaxID=2108445 RepID=UPI000E6C77B8|nr:DUF2460 domain-containing protein [Mesorhizobium sp. DCY119]RJG46434.1 TIGR02217 family protein [Mesorhizobium sp. DCY119]